MLQKIACFMSQIPRWAVRQLGVAASSIPASSWELPIIQYSRQSAAHSNLSLSYNVILLCHCEDEKPSFLTASAFSFTFHRRRFDFFWERTPRPLKDFHTRLSGFPEVSPGIVTNVNILKWILALETEYFIRF